MPGRKIKEPPFGGPTMIRVEKLQGQGITAIILPPKAPPNIDMAKTELTNKKNITTTIKKRDNFLLMLISLIINF